MLAEVAERQDRGRAAITGDARAFVGRDWELAELVEGLDDALVGRGRVLVIQGDAGIGKTRLVEELSSVAAERASVIWARCWEGPGAPALWPWTQVVRSLHDSDASVSLGPVDVLVPGLAEEDGPVEIPSSDGARFRLYDAVIAYVRAQAAKRAAVLVFDDLQWADVESLRLLDLFAGQVRDVPVLCVGTHREVEPESSPEQGAALAAIGRLGQSIPLRGLSKSELQSFVRARFGVAPPRSVVSDLWALTEGNPFFADEVVRLFLAETKDDEPASDLSVPEGVKEVIRRRLKPLPDDTRELLRLASVLGRGFSAQALARAAGSDVERVLAALADTDQQGILEALEGQRFEFAHALIREALYEELDPEERASFHLHAAGALEHAHRHDLDEHRAQIGHHLAEAGGLATPGRALSFLRRAGDVAVDGRFYEEAARCYAKAATVAEADGVDTPGEHAELLLDLGQAHRRAGSAREGLQAFRRAGTWARRTDRPDLLVHAAVGFEDSRFRAGDFETIPEAFLLLSEALEALGPQDATLRAEVLSRRPRIMQFVGGSDEMIPAAEEAVAIAEQTGDRELMLHALEGLRWAYWDPHHAEERLAISERLIAVAQETNDEEARLMGAVWRFVDLFALGRINEMDTQLIEVEGAFEATRQPWFAWWPGALCAARALMQGSLEEAEEYARTVRTIARERGDQMAHALSSLTLGAIGWEASSPELARPVFGAVIDLVPLPSYRATTRAFLEAICDRRPEAERAFEEAAARGFTDLPQGAMRLPLMAVLASTCGYLGDAERAERLYELMSPVPRRVVLVPPATGLSTTPHWLGVLAATAGKTRQAEAHFEEAIAFHTELRAWAWLARTKLEYGRLQMGAEQTRARGRELVREAVDLASSLGLRYIADRATDVLGSTATPSAGGVFRREGDVWHVSYQGIEVRVNDIKGLAYLAVLLKNPGEEFHVLRMLSEQDAGAGSGVRTTDALASGLRADRGDGAEVLDDEAKRTYRRRLDELREEVDDALAMGDVARASKAREEADWLATELSKALGLGGRDRRTGSATERARVNVQRAVRTAVRRISEVHPDLGEHLSATVRTGTFCSYTVSVRWSD